jgi:hypothetical protein
LIAYPFSFKEEVLKNLLHDVTIKQGKSTGSVQSVNVTVDGMEIKGLTDVNYSASVDYPTKITLEFFVGTLNVDKEE